MTQTAAPKQGYTATVAAGCFAVLLAQVAYSLPGALNGTFQQEFQTVGAQLTWITGAFAIPMVVFELTTGVLGDLFGRKRSVVRERLFSDAQPVFSGEHAYRAVISSADAHGMAVDDNLRMYIGRGTKVYFLPLRHRGQVSFDITALCPDSVWTPEVTRDDLLKTVEGFDERIVNITRDLDLDAVNCRAVYDIDPVGTWHSDSVVLVGDAAHSMLHHQGQGANSAILDAGALADALQEAGSVKEALALYQATRKPVTDELQRISRQGWSEDEVNEVFPGQKPASQQPQGA